MIKNERKHKRKIKHKPGTKSGTLIGGSNVLSWRWWTMKSTSPATIKKPRSHQIQSESFFLEDRRNSGALRRISGASPNLNTHSKSTDQKHSFLIICSDPETIKNKKPKNNHIEIKDFHFSPISRSRYKKKGPKIWTFH